MPPPLARALPTQEKSPADPTGNVKEIQVVEHQTVQQSTGFRATPAVPVTSEPTPPVLRKTKALPEGPKATVNFEGLPLPSFINAIYGDILKVSFEIDSSLQTKRDLVSLRAQEPMAPEEIDRLARQVLSNYGVAVNRQGAVTRFLLSKTAAAGEPPLLVSGRTLPEVPVSHRPIFQLVPLKAVRNTNVTGWLKQAYKGQPMEIFEDPERNAILLMGPPDLLEQALEAARLLDQPYMRGTRSIRIEPVFMSAGELADILVNALNAEGYSASTKGPFGSILVLPINSVNAVLAFAADDTILGHIRQWAASLDKPGRGQASGTRVFYYLVKNTSAADIAKVLDKMVSSTDFIGKGSAGNQHQPSDLVAAGVQGAAPMQAQALPKSDTSRRLVVDESRNGLIFQGETSEWETLLAVINEMDRPTRMVLIEVTVAEVTLTDKDEVGIEWLIKDVNIGNVVTNVATNGALGLGTQGLTFKLDNAGQTQAALNAFASRDKVKILSCPRVMVKSGGEAKIDVGTEVPIVTSQSTSSEVTTNGTSGILQQIQYRKTGALLTVKPVIHSGNRIDLDVTQEVSEVQPNSSSDLPSPNIFSRKITTTLSLQDGGSVLLGGLISSSSDTGRSGVPGLQSIPLLGHLFSVDKKSGGRTEMLMLIMPYVISSNEEALAITESLREQFPNAMSQEISPGKKVK